MTVTEDAILAYAEITGDWNPIHVDDAFAAASPMKGRIAHGTLSANLLWQSIVATFGEEVRCRLTLDIRFVRPVRIGDVVEAGGTPASGEARWDVWVRNGAGENVIVGTIEVGPVGAGS
ncbi:MAG: MaoC family dehydratase [Burkholderiales bacterium]|nr:MaoC family dehydratase [Burkholderiales bacterium]